MTESTTSLDEAFDRMARLDFELPNGFVNHGPMACEALAALDLDDQIEGWSRRFAQMLDTGPKAERPEGFGGAGWRSALGDYRRLPEWIGYFDDAVDDQGWAPLVGTWVPRLVPGLGTALFHGVIRTAQAVRAIDAVDTEARRAELARSLAYWAARTGRASPPPMSGPRVPRPPRWWATRPVAPGTTWSSPPSTTCTASPGPWPSNCCSRTSPRTTVWRRSPRCGASMPPCTATTTRPRSARARNGTSVSAWPPPTATMSTR